MKLWLRLLLAVLLLLPASGCQGGALTFPNQLRPENWLPGLLGQATALPQASAVPETETTTPGPANGTQTSLQTVTPIANGTSTGTSTGAASTSPPGGLVLWLPPQFDPTSGTPAGMLLAQRLAEFTETYGLTVTVRIKAANGAGGLLESLTSASAAAPLALPGVVALARPDMETAALKGLIFPLDGLSQRIDEGDWYPYARQLAMVQGETFALPFAGDALVLAYRPARVVAPPITWEAAFRLGQPLAIPAGDPQALLVISLYESLGGKIQDAQGRPMLEPDVLSTVLQLLDDGEQRGLFPYWLSQYETYAQVWQAFHDERVNVLVTWVSDYLTNLPADTTAAALPSLGEEQLTLATGWGWAISDPLPERRELSVKLAEFLADGEFLADWSEAAGVLPTQPSSLAAWSNGSLKTLLSPVAVSSQARPNNDLLASQGVVLKEATLKVLKGEADPTQAAQAAAERLAVPQTR